MPYIDVYHILFDVGADVYTEMVMPTESNANDVTRLYVKPEGWLKSKLDICHMVDVDANTLRGFLCHYQDG